MSSIVVEFEVLPDEGAGSSSDHGPPQICDDLRRQLADPGSHLRRGDFGRYAANATLSAPSIPGDSGGTSAGHVHPGHGHPESDAGGFPPEELEEPLPPPPVSRGLEIQAPAFHSAPPSQSFRPEASFEATGEPPRAKGYAADRDWQGAGLSNAMLVERISDLERQLQRTAAGGRQEAAPPPLPPVVVRHGHSQELEEKCAILQQRVEVAERELAAANEAARQHRQRQEQVELKLKDREQLLVHAKEMWMKENVRASKLADALTVAEDRLADQEKRLSEAAERYNQAQQEVRALQHLVGANGGGGFAVDPYAVDKKLNGRMPATTGDLSAGVTRTAGTGSTFDSSMNMAFTRDLLAGSTRAIPSTTPGMPTVPAMPLDAETNTDRFKQLCLVNDAVLYEDELLQVGIKAEYTGREGHLAVFFGNKGHAALHAFTAQYFVKEENALRLSASPLNQQLEADKQVVQRLSVTMLEAFAHPPWLRVQFLLPDTSPRKIQVKLPIVLTKFMVGREMTMQDFFQTWRQQHFVLNEASSIVHLASRLRAALVQVARSIVFGGALRMHHNVDTNPENFVLVGQFAEPGRPAGDFDGGRGRDAFDLGRDLDSGLALVRVEVGSGRFAGKARVVVRSSDGTVARALCEGIVGQLAESNAPPSDGAVAR